jgi:outer membrane receptor protein involved in Fe transport
MDIATPTSVFTEQFLEDLAITNTDDLTAFMLSAENIDDYENAVAQSGVTNDARTLKIRGLPGGTTTVNFFLTDLRFDTFSLERIEQSRGPNSILFGIGSPGGIINVTTKRASTRRARTTLTAGASSYGGRRFSFDFNVPLGYQFKKKVALRLAAVRDNSDSWRNFEYNNNKRYFGTLKWQIGPRTEFNIEGETGSLDKATKRTYIANNSITRWLNGIAGNGLTGNARFFDNLLSPVAGGAYIPPNIGTGPDGFSNVTAMGRGTSSGALASANRPVFAQYGIRVQAGGGIIGTATPANPYLVYNSSDNTIYNMSGQLAAGILSSPEGENIALAPGETDIGNLPRDTIIYGPGFWQKTDYSRVSATFTHQFGRHLNIELSAYRLTSRRDVMDVDPTSDLYLSVDIDPTLPDGTANPNVGRPYLDCTPQRTLSSTDNKAIRLSLAYDNDFGTWGHHRLAGVYQGYRNLRDLHRFRQVNVTVPWYNANNITGPTNRLSYRTYLGTPAGDPADHNWTLNGAGIVMNDWRKMTNINSVPIIGNETPNAPASSLGRSSADFQWTEFGYSNLLGDVDSDEISTSATGKKKTDGSQSIGILQSDFWKRRVNALIGYSVESIDYSTQGAASSLEPVFRWSGEEKFTARYTSFSLVYHATSWLALTYNIGANTALPRTDGKVLNALPAQAKGRTQDFGVKLNLLKGRLFFNAVYFDTKVTDDYAGIGIKATNYNPMWNAMFNSGLPLTDENGFVARIPKVDADGHILVSTDPGYDTARPYENTASTTLNVKGTPNPSLNNNGASFDSTASGFEFELIANLTENLRIFANYNQSTVVRSNIGRAMVDYINTWHRTWTDNAQMLLNPTSGAAATPAQTIGEMLRLLDRKLLTDYVAQESETPAGQSLKKGNIRVAYDFSTGPLRGFTLLGGVRYSGPMILAYTVNTDGPPTNLADLAPNYNPIDAGGNIITFDETRDPDGKSIGFANANLSGKRKAVGPDNWYLDLGLAYKFMFALPGLARTTWTLQLNVTNVLDNNDVIPIRVSPLSGQMVNYRINDPRQWRLSMRVNF